MHVPSTVDQISTTFRMPSCIALGNDPRVYWRGLCKPESVQVDSIFEMTFRSGPLPGPPRDPFLVSVLDIPGPTIMGHVVRDRIDGQILQKLFAYIAGDGSWLYQFPEGAAEINMLFGLGGYLGTDYVHYAEIERKNNVFVVKLKTRRTNHSENDLVRVFAFPRR